MVKKIEKGGTSMNEQENEVPENTKAEPLHLFDLNPAGLHDLFREFDETMELPEENQGLVRMEELS